MRASDSGPGPSNSFHPAPGSSTQAPNSAAQDPQNLRDRLDELSVAVTFCRRIEPRHEGRHAIPLQTKGRGGRHGRSPAPPAAVALAWTRERADFSRGQGRSEPLACGPTRRERARAGIFVNVRHQ